MEHEEEGNPPAVHRRGSANIHHRQQSVEEDGAVERHVPSLALLAFLGIALNMEYSVLMPTVWGYISSIDGGNKLYLGYAISSFSISRMACFFAVGYWSDKRPMREVFVVTCFLGIVGNALYGLAGRCQSLSLILIARMLTGAGATNAVTSRAYLTRITTARTRTMAIAAQNGIQFLGVMVGPALNLLFSHVDFKIGPYVEVNEFTAAGYFMILPNLLCLIGFLLFFKEPPAPPTGHGRHGSLIRKRHMKQTSSIDTSSLGRMLWSGGWWCLLTAFMTTFNLAALETAITPITQTEFGWGTMQNSYLFSGLAVAALFAIVFTLVLGKRGRYDREIMLYGLALLLLSFAIDLSGLGGGQHVSMWAIVAGGILLAFGLITLANPNSSLFSKMSNDSSQGTHGSTLFFTTAAGRCLGPLAAGVCLSEAIGTTYYPLYGLLLAMTLLSAASLTCLWRRFGRIERQALEKRRRASTVEEAINSSVATANEVLGGTEDMPQPTADEDDDEEAEETSTGLLTRPLLQGGGGGGGRP